MSLFQNSNSNTWRGQQKAENVSYDNANTQSAPHPDPDSNAKTLQDAPFQNRTGSQNNPCPNNAEPQNPSSEQNWMDNPALAGIDPARLQMLSSLAAQAQGKNQNELLSFLMTAASQKNTNGMSFRPDEIETIINVMKIGKSPKEIRQIDRICALMRQFGTMRGFGQHR